MSRPERYPVAPCTSCGACCATSADWPRFTLESETDLARIPVRYAAPDGAGMLCYGDRCAALVGRIGKTTRCAIYEMRPLVCRDCHPGDDACRIARVRHDLPVIASSSG